MDKITFDSSIDLADRITALETGVNAVIDAINALPAPTPAFDPSAILAQMDAFKTELDAFSGRLDGNDKTVSAMGDALKTLTPDGMASQADDIAALKAKANEVYTEVFGPSAPNIPFPK